MGKELWKKLRLWFALFLVAFACGCGPNDAPYQAEQRLHNLAVLKQVKAGGSDWASWAFLWFELPGLISLADTEFSHAAFLDHFERIIIDPARLRLNSESEVRVYFVGEGSGIPNALGLNLEGIGTREGRPQILFPLVNTPVPLDEAARRARSRAYYRSDVFGSPSADAPILPGDFIDLGRLPEDTMLNFFLATPEHIFAPIPEANPDGIPHMVALAVEDSPYLLISFEDLLGGGDEDYEDAVFAVHVSEGNVEALLGRFDPWRVFKRNARRAAWLAIVIGGPLGAVALRRRLRVRRVKQTLAQASQLLTADRPHEAVAILRAAREAAKGSQKRQWEQVFYAAAEQGHDLANLADLYERAPRLFRSNEQTALSVGRAQIESGRSESFDTLRKSWKDRETAKDSWHLLDAAAMFREGRTPEALTLLERRCSSGTFEPARLARLASAKSQVCPNEAAALVRKALETEPVQAETHFWAAETLERLGDLAGALEHFGHAVRLAPQDPFIREGAADFCCRHRKIEGGLRLLSEGLAPPSIDSIWTRFLFWTRVAYPLPGAIDGKEPPPGPLQPLAGFLLQLPSDRFWDERQFHETKERNPGLQARPEVHWLRVLEALRLRKENHARWLLSFERSGWESWSPAFERALLRIIMYRQVASVGLLMTQETEIPARFETSHRFFDTLDAIVRNPGAMISPDLDGFLRGDFVFAAACLAAGWRDAAARMRPAGQFPGDAPEWARALWAQACGP